MSVASQQTRRIAGFNDKGKVRIRGDAGGSRWWCAFELVGAHVFGQVLPCLMFRYYSGVGA